MDPVVPVSLDDKSWPRPPAWTTSGSYGRSDGRFINGATPGYPQPVRRTVRVRLPLRLARPLATDGVDALLASITTARDLVIFLLMLDGGLRPVCLPRRRHRGAPVRAVELPGHHPGLHPTVPVDRRPGDAIAGQRGEDSREDPPDDRFARGAKSVALVDDACHH